MNPERAVSIHHVHDDDLQLYVLGRLTAAELEGFESHVVRCPECQERLSATARMLVQIVDLQSERGSPENRSEPRIRASDAGFLRSFSPLLPDRWPVQIIDVSKNGLGLLVPNRLAPGALVQVQIGTTFVLGEVKYCKKLSEHEFRTGVRVQDVSSGHLGGPLLR